jgi:6-pyruvoyl-tetrahydropterin synthase
MTAPSISPIAGLVAALTQTASSALTGASGHLSAAHRDASGRVHGHTWMLRAWWEATGQDAVQMKRRLDNWISTYDHGELPETMTLGEQIAAQCGERVGALVVEVSREPEGIFALWWRR